MRSMHRVYLIPGMFGFGEMAGYRYFGHMVAALKERFNQAGSSVVFETVAAPPTASMRRRAACIAEAIGRSAERDGAGTARQEERIHFIGHSTGGLDARLVATPTFSLHAGQQDWAWQRRIRSVITMNTPHYGTPLAQFFSTVSGTRLLYALSLLTVTTLKAGGLPLTIFSNLVATLGQIDQVFGMDVRLLDRTTDLILRFVGDKGRNEVRSWLDGIRQDQGGIIQITPEAMDLFNAAVIDSPTVRYGCTATAAPPPGPRRFVGSVRSAYAALSATAFSTVYTVTSLPHSNYPYPAADASTLQRLAQGIRLPVNDRSNDGIVPTLSMLWGELLWCGQGDHLDVVGFFRDDQRPALHSDWLSCGAGFNRNDFGQAMDALATFLLRE